MIPALTSVTGLSPNEFKISGLGASVPTAVGPQALSGAGTADATQQTGAAQGANFGDALSKTIGSLDNSQAVASSDSEKLATGQLSDPTTAVTAVENASLEMSFASQIRNQLDTAATTIFQTQL